MFPRLPVQLCVILSLGAGGAAAQEAPAGPFRLELDPADPPGAYSWDGGITSVPWSSGRSAPQVVYGELGRTPTTGLYLTFEGEDPSTELALQPPAWIGEALGIEATAGRFGRGARLTERSVLRCELPEVPPERRAWTIELWFHPDAPGPAALFELPGTLRVRTDAAGRVFLHVPNAGAQREDGGFADLMLGSEGNVEIGAWNHLGVVLDLLDLNAVRVVLNGRVQGRRFAPEQGIAAPRAFVLGDARGDGGGAAMRVDELRIEQRNLSTAELADHHAAAPRPLERLALQYPDGRRAELELWTRPVREPWIDSAVSYDRGELVHAVSTERGLEWTPESWRRIRAPEFPLARTTHATAALGGRQLLLFGGETRDTHFGRIENTDDTWIFDGATERWTRVPTARAPSGRCHMPMAYSPDHGLVLLVGGWYNAEVPGRAFGDAWVFDVAERQWRECSSPGESAQDNVLAYLPERRAFLLFERTRVQLFDPAANAWTRLRVPRVVDEQGTKLSELRGHSRSAVVDARGQVFLFGGRTDEGFLDTTALYQVDRNTLTVLDPPVAPAPRVRPGIAYDPVGDRVVLFGGVRDELSERFDDLWVFEFASRSWREIPRGQGRPVARGGYYGMDRDPLTGRFVLTHGRHSASRFLDETWTLELDERAPGHARHLFDRRDFASGLGWDAEVATPGDSRVSFRFRGGDDAQRLGEWRAEPPQGTRWVEVETVLVPGSNGEVPRVGGMGFRPR